MIKVVCSVYDLKAAVFSNPFYAPNVPVAKRDFAYAVTDQSTGISRNPEDYSLFQVATFDDESGVFIPFVPPCSWFPLLVPLTHLENSHAFAFWSTWSW